MVWESREDMLVVRLLVVQVKKKKKKVIFSLLHPCHRSPIIPPSPELLCLLWPICSSYQSSTKQNRQFSPMMFSFLQVLIIINPVLLAVP